MIHFLIFVCSYILAEILFDQLWLNLLNVKNGNYIVNKKNFKRKTIEIGLSIPIMAFLYSFKNALFAGLLSGMITSFISILLHAQQKKESKSIY